MKPMKDPYSYDSGTVDGGWGGRAHERRERGRKTHLHIIGHVYSVRTVPQKALPVAPRDPCWDGHEVVLLMHPEALRSLRRAPDRVVLSVPIGNPGDAHGTGGVRMDQRFPRCRGTVSIKRLASNIRKLIYRLAGE